MARVDDRPFVAAAVDPVSAEWDAVIDGLLLELDGQDSGDTVAAVDRAWRAVLADEASTLHGVLRDLAKAAVGPGADPVLRETLATIADEWFAAYAPTLIDRVTAAQLKDAAGDPDALRDVLLAVPDQFARVLQVLVHRLGTVAAIASPHLLHPLLRDIWPPLRQAFGRRRSPFGSGG